MTTPWVPQGTVYGTLLNFNAERAALAAQMIEPPYKAPPQAPVLFIKTANTFNPDGGVVQVPEHVQKIEIGATFGMIIRALDQSIRVRVAPVNIAGWVSGFVLMNDMSIPHTSFFRPPVKFKCLDGLLGVGQQLVSTDVAGDPAHFNLELRGVARHISADKLLPHTQKTVKTFKLDGWPEKARVRDGHVIHEHKTRHPTCYVYRSYSHPY